MGKCAGAWRGGARTASAAPSPWSTKRAGTTGLIVCAICDQRRRGDAWKPSRRVAESRGVPDLRRFEKWVSTRCSSSRFVSAPELKQKLVAEFSEVSQKDMDEASDDPDDIVDRVQKKTGQPREQVEQRVNKVMQRS